jgi:hypothetical protein
MHEVETIARCMGSNKWPNSTHAAFSPPLSGRKRHATVIASFAEESRLQWSSIENVGLMFEEAHPISHSQ